jgi:hypothetical protein
MSELEDIKLKALLQEMKLDSPEPNFSVRVMNKIFEESNALERIKSEKILGKGFWIILLLFLALTVAVFFMSNTGVDSSGSLNGLLPEMNGVSEGYQSVLGKLGSVPLGVGGFLAAFSILLFIDKFIISNSKIFA